MFKYIVFYIGPSENSTIYGSVSVYVPKPIADIDDLSAIKNEIVKSISIHNIAITNFILIDKKAKTP
jgi:hypothetical protein